MSGHCGTWRTWRAWKADLDLFSHIHHIVLSYLPGSRKYQFWARLLSEPVHRSWQPFRTAAGPPAPPTCSWGSRGHLVDFGAWRPRGLELGRPGVLSPATLAGGAQSIHISGCGLEKIPWRSLQRQSLTRDRGRSIAWSCLHLEFGCGPSSRVLYGAPFGSCGRKGITVGRRVWRALTLGMSCSYGHTTTFWNCGPPKPLQIQSPVNGRRADAHA